MNEEVDNKIGELNKILSESRETLGKINEHKDEAAKKFQSIQKFCDECETLGLVFHKEKINDYKKRAQKLQAEVVIWGAVKVFSLIFLTLTAFLIYRTQNSDITSLFPDMNQWSQYIFMVPVIYLAYLSTRNYDKTRGLLERYEYKTATLSTLPTDIQLLKQEFPGNQSEILDFALEKMDLIFKEPYSTKKTKKSFFFKLKNIFNGSMEEEESNASAPVADHSKLNGVRVSEVKVVERKGEHAGQKTKI